MIEINRSVLLPNLLTLGNGICGFYALTQLFRVELVDGGGPLEFTVPAAFAAAAWAVLLGMVFDVFDGKVARLSGGGTALGAQLDSLCDLVTFGLVPAAMMIRLNMGYEPTWQRVVWFFSLAYFVGAILRLARFTAENGPEEEEHLAFKGLPSPAAAGCVASLVIFYRYVEAFRAPELQWLLSTQAEIQRWVAHVPAALPVLGIVLGFAMVSDRLRCPHVGTLFLQRKQSFDVFVYLIFGAILVAVVPEVVFPVLFLGYLVSMPAVAVYRAVVDRRGAAALPHDNT